MKTTLTEADLVRLVGRHAMLSPKDARDAVDAFVDAIVCALALGEEVILHDLGRFWLNRQKPHARRNQFTGQPYNVPLRRKVKFRPSERLFAAAASAPFERTRKPYAPPRQAKLTEDDVRAIRASNAATCDLARQYGVSWRCVHLTRTGKRWKNVT